MVKIGKINRLINRYSFLIQELIRPKIKNTAIGKKDTKKSGLTWPMGSIEFSGGRE
jgi:hypothetical protein